MNLDIHDAVVTLIVLILLGAVVCVWGGVRAIRKGRKVSYYRLRQRQVAAGWWTIVFAFALAMGGVLLGQFGEPTIYQYFPPSPSPTLTGTVTFTPTISLTSTISLTPTITGTPAVSYTPTITVTPFMPIAIEAQFESLITPNPAAIFSPLSFSKSIANFQAVDPQTVFQNPVGRMFATYSYDGMLNGVQWSALWYRNGELAFYETGPWEGSTGGYGYAEWNPPAEEWLEGTYQVIFFVGMEWKTLGEFRVYGDPPTLTPSLIPSISPTSTLTRMPTQSPTITRTPTPSRTARPSDTRWPTQTPIK